MASPIALFVYNRPSHTRQTVEALQKNVLAGESDLYIFSDGPKSNSVASVEETRAYLKTINGFKSVTIHENEVNRGLAASIIYGVTKVLQSHETIIIVEDDLVTSPYFLSFLNQGLKLYENDEGVASVCAFFYPVKEPLPQTFFLKTAESLGWATWRRGWKIFEPDGKKLLDELKSRKAEREFNFNNAYSFTRMLRYQTRGMVDSWAIRWYASVFLQNKVTLYSGTSFLKNIGFDDSGTNSSKWDKQRYETEIQMNEPRLERIEVKENLNARGVFERYLRRTQKPLWIKIENKLRSLLRKI